MPISAGTSAAALGACDRRAAARMQAEWSAASAPRATEERASAPRPWAAARDHHDRDEQRAAPRCPSRTASVRLPTALSVGMSRRLFTISSAHASSPTGTASQSTLASSRSCCTNAVPHCGDEPEEHEHGDLAEPARGIRLRSARVQRPARARHSAPAAMSHGVVSRARTIPATAAMHTITIAAAATARGGASPEATRRRGPMRAAVSTPLHAVEVVVGVVDARSGARWRRPARAASAGSRRRCARPTPRRPARGRLPRPGFAAAHRSTRRRADPAWAPPRRSRSVRELREVGFALLDVRVAAFLRLLAHVEEERGVAGELLDAGEPVGCRR